MMTIISLINAVLTFCFVLRVFRSSHFRAMCMDAMRTMSRWWLNKTIIVESQQAKMQETLDAQRLQNARYIITTIKEKMDLAIAIQLTVWLARIYWTPGALNSSDIALQFLIQCFIVSVADIFFNHPQLVTKTILRITHSGLLFAMFAFQLFSDGIAAHSVRVPHTCLRLGIGIIISDFRFCLVSNMFYSVLFCVGVWCKIEDDAIYSLIGSEARLMVIVFAVLMATKRTSAGMADHSLKLQASIGSQWAMWSLLEAQYDAVIQLGPDMRIHRALPRVKGFFAMHDSFHEGMAPAADRPTSVTDAPINSFMPMPEAEAHNALEGHMLSHFMSSLEDRHRLEKSLRENLPSNQALHETQVVHVSVQDKMDQSMSVRLYHACFMDLLQEHKCYLVGICENSEREILESPQSMPRPDDAKNAQVESSKEANTLASLLDSMTPELYQLGHIDPCSVLVDLLGADLNIIQASLEWVAQFGNVYKSLRETFDGEDFVQFQMWLQKEVNENMFRVWDARKSKHDFGRLKIMTSGGSHVEAMVALRMLDPSQYFLTDNSAELGDAVYLAIISVDCAVLPSRRRGSHSSRSSSSSLKRRTLPAVAEEGVGEVPPLRSRIESKRDFD